MDKQKKPAPIDRPAPAIHPAEEVVKEEVKDGSS
jgi:hypothetical protein